MNIYMEMIVIRIILMIISLLSGWEALILLKKLKTDKPSEAFRNKTLVRSLTVLTLSAIAQFV